MTRRPIKTRGAAWVQSLSKRLADSGTTPNQISIASVLFAALAWLAFSATIYGTYTNALWLLVAAICIQLRLLCNLLDGLVAVEGGKSAPDGPFWNEAPDRAADLLILAGLGLAAGSVMLGLLAGGLAITTAYLREFGRAEGMEPDFSGPFAKPQRMAAATLGCLLAAASLAISSNYAGTILWITLVIITLGTALTIGLRARRLIRWLNSR